MTRLRNAPLCHPTQPMLKRQPTLEYIKKRLLVNLIDSVNYSPTTTCA